MTETMDRFAAAQAARLLGKLAFQVRHAAKRPNEKAIKDLRVSIRRLSQCLDEFRQFFPRHHVKKILKQLGKVMDMAAKMRNRDVAIELIGRPGGAALKTLQQYLGEISDCATTRELLAGRDDLSKPERDRLTRQLKVLAAARIARFRRLWRKDFAPPERERWWTDYLRRFAR